MSQIPFDQLSKQYLEESLAPLREVKRSLEIPGESKFVDIYFSPNVATTIGDLGILGRMIQTSCLLEPVFPTGGTHDLFTGIFGMEQVTRQQGRQEGRQEGQIALILRLLTRRLGALPEQVRSQINALSIAQLESLADALLDFSNLQDLEAWLSNCT